MVEINARISRRAMGLFGLVKAFEARLERVEAWKARRCLDEMLNRVFRKWSGDIHGERYTICETLMASLFPW